MIDPCHFCAAEYSATVTLHRRQLVICDDCYLLMVTLKSSVGYGDKVRLIRVYALHRPSGQLIEDAKR